MKVHYNATKNFSFDFGIDNLFNEQYFLFHPFPGRTFVLAGNTRSEPCRQARSDKNKEPSMRPIARMLRLAPSRFAVALFAAPAARRGGQGRRSRDHAGLEPRHAEWRQDRRRLPHHREQGTAPDRLIGGSADIAGKVEVHEMATNNGVMTMRPLDKGLTIDPGKTVKLAPGGYHLMMFDLKARSSRATRCRSRSNSKRPAR